MTLMVPAEGISQMPAYLPFPLLPETTAHEEGEFLKEARSYCPTCMRVLDARVYAHESHVWIYKTCPDHGPSQGLVEKNVAFYKKVMNLPPVQAKENTYLTLTVTHRCNLACSICFVPTREHEDLPLEDLKRIATECEETWIGLSGGEATLRDDIPELIAYIVGIGKRISINTNGVRLADEGYVKTLADAGLRDVTLSFNGLNDEIYQKINGRALLDVKRRALDNLIENDFYVVISPTIVRGVNEDLGPLLKLCLDHAPHVVQLRTRTAAHVGRHGAFHPLVLSELIDLIAKAMGTTLERIMDEFEPNSCWHSATQFTLQAFFHDSGQGQNRLLHWFPGEYSKEPFDPRRLLADARRVLGDGFSVEALEGNVTPLDIINWNWPDRYNYDIDETLSHGVTHLYKNKERLNFYEATLRAEEI